MNGKDKGKDNDKVTEHFAGYSDECETWGHMKKDRWWNEASKSGEATSSIASKPESLMTGMLLPFQRYVCKAAGRHCDES